MYGTDGTEVEVGESGERHGVRGGLSSRSGREEGVTGVQAASADCFI